MHETIVGAVLALSIWAIGNSALAQSQTAPPRDGSARQAKTSSDAATDTARSAIRAAADAYVAAYNQHDAKAIGDLFTHDAQIVDQRGHTIQGRDAIARLFATAFAEFPQAECSVEIKDIRLLSPSLAAENGTAKVALVPGEPAESIGYTVIHTKQDDRWLMASARDLVTDGPGASSQLEQLAWLIGSWVDEGADSVITSEYRWDEKRHFILGEFKIHVSGQPVMSGTQRIGWDPLEKTIRSWVFDSEGGFSEGVYTRTGDRWMINMTGVTADGQPASSTNVLAPAGADRMTWQSHNRVIGGEPQPPILEVTSVRPPPSAK